MLDCIFCKIVKNQIPGKKIYEDDDLLAFHDIHPIARVHFMIIPKSHVDSLDRCTVVHQSLLGKMLLLAPKLAKKQGLENGFRTMINTGHDGGQEVYHLHVHVFGGDALIPRT
jgi:histidine triad (HIT) family protein